MNQANLSTALRAFLDASPTPFHAVANVANTLEQAGFTQLSASDSWQLEAGKGYYTCQNGSSIIAWKMPLDKPLHESGLRMLGAHTDSPCLKVKPNPELNRHGYFQLGVEVYGGVLLNPWFDRDLSLAGRVSYLDVDGQLQSALIDFKRPIAIIPSLAIHLDREANKGRQINAQTMLPPVLQVGSAEQSFRQLLAEQLKEVGIESTQVMDYELSFYDTQPAALVGLNEELLASARLDNLLSCFVTLEALLQSDSEQGCLLVFNDHEEVGSMSAVGAQGPMLDNVLERLESDVHKRSQMLANSMLISADNAHAVHPNFADKHDANHGPQLNAGPVIKLNANQRYASNDITSSMFRCYAQQAGVEVQSFVVRSDMACGSTIGPITAAEIGVKTLDIGIAQWGMHSIRETTGVADVEKTIAVLKHYLLAPSVA